MFVNELKQNVCPLNTQSGLVSGCTGIDLPVSGISATRAEALRTMTVTGQRLLQEPGAVSDDDDEGDNTVLVETRSEESECKESKNGESENEEEFEPLTKRPCSPRSGCHESSFIL